MPRNRPRLRHVDIAYARGKEHFAAGGICAVNPYQANSSAAVAWLLGFHDAQREAAARLTTAQAQQ